VLPWNLRQEELCRAFVQSIASLCGLSSTVPRLDFGIDIILHEIVRVRNRLIESGFRLDIQAKSTTLACLENSFVRYDLDVRTYDVLRMAAPGTLRILVVLVLPTEPAQWLTQSEDSLLLRHCAYWLSLQGQVATRNRKTVRVRIPRTNQLSVAGLEWIVGKIKKGEPL
jgi:hypothetical protein